MSITPTNDPKKSLTITNEDKLGRNVTWDEATWTWDESDNATWDLQGLHVTKESKNSLTVNPENKT